MLVNSMHASSVTPYGEKFCSEKVLLANFSKSSVIHQTETIQIVR